MAELCLVASHGYLPGNVLQQEPASSKDRKPILQSPGTGHDIIRSASNKLKPIQCEDPLKPVTGFLESTQFIEIDSIVRKPVLVDVQDTNPDSVFLTYGIAGMCNRREQILQNLVRGLSEEKSGLDFSLRSDVMGFQTFSSDLHGRLLFAPSLIYPISEFDAQNPLVDFVADLARGSKVMVNPDGKVLFSGSRTEMKDILSIVAEFNLSKDPTKWRKQPFLVPYFDRLDSLEVQTTTIHGSSLNPKAVTVAPAKSPEKIQLKPLKKKKKKRCGNVGRERDLCKRNSFHACEILLSLMMNKRLKGKTAIVSLKKSGPELPELLTQFSAGIAGTGLAVLLSVVCKVACARVPFCASKLLSTGFGFGFVWLSWSVNRLRDTIVSISKNTSKGGLKEEEMVQRVDKSVQEIYFRAATLLAMAMLRLV